MAAYDDEQDGTSTDPGGDELSRALRELSEGFRAHDRELAHRMRLKPSEFHAMEHILGARGGLGPVELASRLGLAVATTSELLDRLQNLGHVDRQRDQGDGRRVRLAPTASTVSAIIAAIAPATAALERVGARYTSEQRTVIASYLNEVIAALASETSAADSGAPPDDDLRLDDAGFSRGEPR